MATDRLVQTATKLIEKYGVTAVFSLTTVGTYNPATDTTTATTSTLSTVVSPPLPVSQEMNEDLALKSMFYCYVSGENYDAKIRPTAKLTVLSKQYTVYKVENYYKNDTLVLCKLYLSE